MTGQERVVPVADASDGSVVALWWCPPGDGRPEVLLIEPIAGAKRFRRVWLNRPTMSDDWTWHMPSDAVRVS